MSILPDQKQLDVPLAVVTIHDACPAFSSKISKFTDEVEGLDIKYNIAKLLYMVFITRIEMASLMIFIQ
jgi:hypothetical protein